MVITKIVQTTPIPQTDTYFIDGLSNGIREIHVHIFKKFLVVPFLSLIVNIDGFDSCILFNS